MRLAVVFAFVAVAASANPSPVHRLRCDLRTAYDGKVKRSNRLVLLGPRSWREAEAGQQLTELCASKAAEGYRCSLTQHAFMASVGAGEEEPSTVTINLDTGKYVDRGYMDGKPIKSTGTCRPL
jgi:hypothetical protein